LLALLATNCQIIVATGQKVAVVLDIIKFSNRGDIMKPLEFLNDDERDQLEELEDFADSQWSLYLSREIPIQKNLQRKIDKGIFDFDKSVKLWRYWADDANQRYKKALESYHPLSGKKPFSTNVRHYLAFKKAYQFLNGLEDLTIEHIEALEATTKIYTAFVYRRTPNRDGYLLD